MHTYFIYQKIISVFRNSNMYLEKFRQTALLRDRLSPPSEGFNFGGQIGIAKFQFRRNPKKSDRSDSSSITISIFLLRFIDWIFITTADLVNSKNVSKKLFLNNGFFKSHGRRGRLPWYRLESEFGENSVPIWVVWVTYVLNLAFIAVSIFNFGLAQPDWQSHPQN